MTGVSECSQQRGNLKDDGYIQILKLRCHSDDDATTNYRYRTWLVDYQQ
ncbi:MULTISPECIES: hypothetical protein [Photorhabdus]|nr:MULTISPECIES: hypothetical protein [Photorhabdus]NDL50712.1 hypothetical protein [Photorhabdus laumondii subsp. laumondii]